LGTGKLRGLFVRGDVYLEVIVCDRDLALMKATNTIFPKVANLVCRFHINKNVKEKCNILVNSR